MVYFLRESWKNLRKNRENLELGFGIFSIDIFPDIRKSLGLKQILINLIVIQAPGVPDLVQ